MTAPVLELAFDRYGDGGATIVVLHGLLGSSRNWQAVARRLADRHRVLAFDLRNHGRSPHASSMGFDEMVADLTTAISAQAEAPVHLIGHSLGGKVAMLLAMDYSALVASLVVVDIAPVTYPDRHSMIVELMRRAPLDSFGSRADADAWFSASIPELALRQFLLTNLERGPDGFAWRPNLPAIAQALPELASFPELLAGARYAGDTVFIGGERSDYRIERDRDAILARFPRATMKLIPDAGHWPHAEQADAFNDCLSGFLATGAN